MTIEAYGPPEKPMQLTGPPSPVLPPPSASPGCMFGRASQTRLSSTCGRTCCCWLVNQLAGSPAAVGSPPWPINPPESVITTPVTITTANNTRPGQQLRPDPATITTTPAPGWQTQVVAPVRDEAEVGRAEKSAGSGGPQSLEMPRFRPRH